MVHGQFAVDGFESVVHGMGSFMMLWFMVLPALVAILLIVLIVRMLRSRGTEGTVGDEVRLLQEMHRTMDRLEQRVDSLETLLHDADASRRPSGDWRGGGDRQ